MTRWSVLVLAVLLLGVVAGATAAAGPAAAQAPAGWDVQMLGQVNAVRAQAGAAPLVLCANLNEAALTQSNHMDLIDRMQHQGPGGNDVPDRAEAAGYVGWNRLGENVAYTYGYGYDVAVVMQVWIDSAGHYENLVRPQFTHLGVAVVHSSSDDTHYWTQVFGAGGECGTSGGSGHDGTFVDVSPQHPFYEEIEWLAAEGIADGFPDGSFGAGLSVTRQAMAAFLLRSSGAVAPECDPARFWDVGAGHPFCAEITWLADSAITEGFDDGSFGPTLPVTRQAMAAFLHRIGTASQSQLAS